MHVIHCTLDSNAAPTQVSGKIGMQHLLQVWQAAEGSRVHQFSVLILSICSANNNYSYFARASRS